MSIKRLTTDERATYLLGLAVRRHWEDANAKGDSSPQAWKPIEAISRWVERWLTPAEVDDIGAGTGWILRKELADELMGRPPRPDRVRKPPKPDGIPF